MAKTTQLLFWTAGVLFTPLEQAVMEAMPQDDTAKGARLVMSPKYKRLRQQLALGEQTEAAFFESLAELAELRMDTADFAAKVKARFRPVEGALYIASQPRAEIARRLVVDVPRSWLLPWLEEPQTRAVFDPGETLFLDESGLNSLIPDVFDYLVEKSCVAAESCLLLDADLRRTVQSINAGLPADIVQNNFQMEREFLLRKMTPEHYVMHTRPT